MEITQRAQNKTNGVIASSAIVRTSKFPIYTDQNLARQYLQSDSIPFFAFIRIFATADNKVLDIYRLSRSLKDTKWHDVYNSIR